MKKILSVILLLFVSFSIVGCSRSAAKDETSIIAHRGASYIAPENTVASALMAFERNADIVEIDVYLSSDNRIMVIHDNNTERTAGANLDVAKSTSQQLRELEVGSFKDAVYAGEKIPFLEEIIEVLPKGKSVFIEVKGGSEMVPFLKKAIQTSGKSDQIVIISFKLDVLKECKKAMPAVDVCWVRSCKKDKQTNQCQPYDAELIEIAQENGFEGLILNYRALTREYTQKVKEAGLMVYVWTVDQIRDAQRMKEYGVDGITTNRPGYIGSALSI